MQKKRKIFERWGLRPQTPVPPAAGGIAPRPPKQPPPLQISGYALGLEVDFPNAKRKYVFAVIYRHPCNNTNAFLEALDDNVQKLHKKRPRVIIMGDINVDLSSNHHSLSQNDYLRTIKSNGFSTLITNPTRVTTTSQTIIDHILINVHDSVLTPGVFSNKLADHYLIFCKVSTSVCHTTKNDDTYTS